MRKYLGKTDKLSYICHGKADKIRPFNNRKGDKDMIKRKIDCLIREKVVTFRMVKLNMLLSIFLITK